MNKNKQIGLIVVMATTGIVGLVLYIAVIQEKLNLLDRKVTCLLSATLTLGDSINPPTSKNNLIPVDQAITRLSACDPSYVMTGASTK